MSLPSANALMAVKCGYHSTNKFLTTKNAKTTKDSEIHNSKLRALRALRGDICFAYPAPGAFKCESFNKRP